LGLSNNTSKFSGGTFMLSAATSTIVANSSIKGTSVITFSPANATAALTLRTSGLFVSAQTAASGFTVSTQAGTPVGSEMFQYFVYNPV